MGIDKTFFATRRRNVSPTSSILRTVTRDMDCTGTDFDQPPEDGQFINCQGETGKNPDKKFGDVLGGAADATSLEANGLKMVWASAMQSDRQALGDKRVPVLWQGAIEVECKLFDADKNVALLTQYPIGSPVTVKVNATSVALKPNGANAAEKRLVLAPRKASTVGWDVGYVTAVNSPGIKPKNGDSITVMLYDQARRSDASA